MTFGYERNDLMNTVGLSGEDWLDLGALISQASELIKIFIGEFIYKENLPIYHVMKSLIFQNTEPTLIYKRQLPVAQFFTRSCQTKSAISTSFIAW